MGMEFIFTIPGAQLVRKIVGSMKLLFTGREYLIISLQEQ